METRDVRKFWRNVKIYFLFAIAVIAFALFGLLPSNMTGLATGGMAATVNGETISIADFLRAVQRAEEQARAQMDALPPADRVKRTAELRSEVLRELAGQQLVFQAAKSSGLLVAEAEIRDRIMELPYFKTDGQFDAFAYRRILEQNNFTPGQFETSVRQDTAINHMRQLFAMAFKTSKQETELDDKMRDFHLNVEYIEIDGDNLPVAARPTAAQIAAWEKADGRQAEIEAFYGASKAKYFEAEAVRARHLLIKFAGGEDAKKRARAEIDKLREQALAGDFAALARKHSQDAGSKDRGGDLGFFERGRMLPAFEKAAFEQPVGQVGSVVETDYGFHLIKVEEKRAARQRPLEEVRGEIAATLASRDQANRLRAELSSKLPSWDRAALDRWVAERGWQWRETGEFNLTRPQAPRGLEAAGFLAAISGLRKPGDFGRALAESDSRGYLLALKSSGLKSTPDMNMAAGFDFLAMFRTQNLFNSWQEQLLEQGNVVFNQQVLR
jgi:peptidyl-prolyl cis-trans isomerase D